MRLPGLTAWFAAAAVFSACGSNEEREVRTPSALVIVSGDNQLGRAGYPLGIPLVVRVNDQHGDPLKAVPVAFAVTAGGGHVSDATVRTDDLGEAATSWVMGTTLDSAPHLTASVHGLNAIFGATVQAGPATLGAIIQGNGQTGEVGAPLAQPIVVEFRDQFGNLTPDVPVTWRVSNGGGSVSASSTTDGQGRSSAIWTLGLALGDGHSLVADAGVAIPGVTAHAILGPGATLSIVSGDSQGGLAGARLAAQLKVRVRTAAGQGVSLVPVTWTVTSGGGGLLDAVTLTDASGTAGTAWTLGPSAGSQTLSAGYPGTTPSSVTLYATSVAPLPSTIAGSIVRSNSLVSTSLRREAGLRGSMKPLRASAEREVFPVFPRVRRQQVVNPVSSELLVRFRPQAVRAPLALRAMASVSTAQSVGQSMRVALGGHLVDRKVRLTGVSPAILTARLRVSDPAMVDSVALALAADPAIASVSRDGWVRAHGGPVRQGVIPNDPFYPVMSWNYAMVDLPRAWSMTPGSSSVIVAVLDNGAVFHHPAVGAPGATAASGGGNLRNDGYDFVSTALVPLCASIGGNIDNAGDGNGYDPDPSTPDDRDPDQSGLPCGRATIGGHGTHVAGTIGAVGNDLIGTVGVNWQVGIRPVRVLGIDGGSYFDIAQGVLYAAGFPADNGSGGIVAPPTQPARIINMSLGGPCLTGFDPLHAAIQLVTDPGGPNGGAVVVASAGNENSPTPACPAAYPEVISVGAVGPSGHRASYSNFGAGVDVAAPGGDFPQPLIASYGVLSTTCDFSVFPNPCAPNYAFYTGTSMAAPHVSGIAALLIARTPTMTAGEIRARLVNYATPLDPGEQIGSGIVNARNAMTQTVEPPHRALVRIIDPATGAQVASAQALGSTFSIGNLADGSYLVVAGEDDDGDGQTGLPGRRLGAYGGIALPLSVDVSANAGAFVNITAGFPAEAEPNDGIGAAKRLLVDGSMQGSLSTTDIVDYYYIRIPVAGTYSFETTGLQGAYCGWAANLDTFLELLDANGLNILAWSQDIDEAQRNYCSLMTVQLAPGTYNVRVTRDFSSVGAYILQARSGP